ncbi:MAG TPA: flagellar biosynthesis anti-sigma factor FlgM [Candidatus Binatia bacterium]
MKISGKELVDSSVSQQIKNEKGVAPVRGEAEKETRQSGSTARISISAEARYLQKAAELAGRGDELRAEKVQRIKEQLDQGSYHVDAGEVAKSIARSEVARLLGKQ